MDSLLNILGQVTAVLGCQWGDEGKGKLVDILSEKYDITARATGGANAGHTVYVKEGEETKKFIFHLMPAGILREGKICVIGNGLVIHMPTLLEEIEILREAGITVGDRLKISHRAHLLLEYHKLVDSLQEEEKGKQRVGTTRRGIGPCYADKINRIGIRVCDLLDVKKFAEQVRANVKILRARYGHFEYKIDQEIEQYRKIGEMVKPFIVDTAEYLHEALTAGRSVLIEGANGAMLDVDHGTYPFVTSSSPTVGGVFTGLGLAPQKLGSVVGILKAYCTRVGGGPFPTELLDQLGDDIREKGGEFGATTGRPRRCGWFDAVAARYALRLNGVSFVNLTKVDVLSDLPKIKIGVAYNLKGKTVNSPPPCLDDLEACAVEYIEMEGWQQNISDVRNYDDLPENCQKYIAKIEELTECPVKFIGVGQRRDQMVVKG